MSLRRTAALLETESYPLSASELTDRHGSYEIELPNGQERLATIVERSGAEEFHSALDAQETIYGAVSSKALARVGYSDRDPTPAGMDGPAPVSF